MTQGWICLNRSDSLNALIRDHPAAFLLLTQIAIRARWTEDICPVTKLGYRECRIGDWRNAGLASEKQYRLAKKVLIDCQFGAFRGASRGTVATLLPLAPYGFSNDCSGQAEGQARGGQGATKNKVIRKDEEKEDWPSLPFPSDSFRNSWEEWLSFRKEKKKPITPKAAARQFAEFVRYGEQAAKLAIESSILNDYQGVFPAKFSKIKPTVPTEDEIAKQKSRQ